MAHALGQRNSKKVKAVSCFFSPHSLSRLFTFHQGSVLAAQQVLGVLGGCVALLEFPVETSRHKHVNKEMATCGGALKARVTGTAFKLACGVFSESL